MHLYQMKMQGVISDEYYRRYDKIPKQVVRKAKILLNGSYIINSKNKSSATWNLVKSYTKNHRKVVSLLNNLQDGDIDYQKTVDKMNEMFIGPPPSSVTVDGGENKPERRNG
ncbi:hypothetical protein HHI36_001680, partial [Cryptolaemus montrouzieri]